MVLWQTSCSRANLWMLWLELHFIFSLTFLISFGVLTLQGRPDMGLVSMLPVVLSVSLCSQQWFWTLAASLLLLHLRVHACAVQRFFYI